MNIINDISAVRHFSPVRGVVRFDAGVAAQSESNVVTRDRRFDIFENNVSQNFIDNLNAKIYDNIGGVLKMSPSDRRAIASNSKENMKRLVNQAIVHEKAEIERFCGLKDRKEYYESVLAEDGYIREGKYEFSGKIGQYVPKNEVEDALDKIQGEIDGLVTAKEAKESDPLDSRTFEYIYSKTMFLAATGMKYFDAADDPIGGQWTRTEDNFLESAYSSVDSLNKRLKDIDRVYDSFLNDDGFEERITKEGYDTRRIDALMTNFNKWGKNAVMKLTSLNGIDQNELFKSLEDIVKSN